MGMIQQGINQLIGTVGLAARLSPDYEKKKELHALGQQEKALKMQLESFDTLSELDIEEGKETGEGLLYKNITKKQSEAAQRRFELDPTEKNRVKAEFAMSAAGQGPLMRFRADPEEIEMEREEIRGQQRAEEEALRQLKQQQRFNEFVEMFTEGGKYR